MWRGVAMHLSKSSKLPSLSKMKALPHYNNGGHMNLHKMQKHTDLGVLDEIIKLAEGAMINPLKKKKGIEVTTIKKIGDNPQDMAKPDLASLSGDESGEPDSLSKSGIPDGDLEELLEEYKKMKGG